MRSDLLLQALAVGALALFAYALVYELWYRDWRKWHKGRSRRTIL